MRWRHLAVMAAWLGLACNGNADSPEAETLPAADTQAVMEGFFTPADFDTVRWASEAEAIEAGRRIYQQGCIRCHGAHGEGGLHTMEDGDTMRTPSFVESNWDFAEQPDSIRHQVYVGNEKGMPHWGMRLTPREITAVDLYVRRELRRNQQAG